MFKPPFTENAEVNAYLADLHQRVSDISDARVWAGTGSAAGVLGGIPQTFVCERNTAGTVLDVMAYGDGSTVHHGLHMPFDGYLLYADLSAHNINGTLEVQAYLNSVAQPTYSLSLTGSNEYLYLVEKFALPLRFRAGDTLGWQQIAVPTSADGYKVIYTIVYD
jgi:hypothetical protein